MHRVALSTRLADATSALPAKIRALPPAVLRLLACSFLAAMAGLSRLWVVRRFAVDVPYWDQWDNEVVGLYDKVMGGTLSLPDLLRPANEHRILCTRLLDLALFFCNDQHLRVKHGMYAQTIVATCTLAVMLWALNRRHYFLAPSLWLTAIPVLPLAWENIFWSYQSQVYFAIFFAVCALALAARQRPPVWATAGCVLLHGATMASGAFTALTIAATFAWRCWHTKQRRHLMGTMVHLTLMVGIIKITWHNPGHDAQRAQNIGDFAANLYGYVAWPSLPLPGAGLLAWSVGAVGAWRLVRQRRPLPYEQRFALLLFCWVAMACASAAYARSGGISNRYLDYLTLSWSAAILMVARPLSTRPLRATGFYGSVAACLLCAAVLSTFDAAVMLGRRRVFADQVRRALELGGQATVASTLQILQENPHLGFPNDEGLATILCQEKTQHMLRHLAAPRRQPRPNGATTSLPQLPKPVAMTVPTPEPVAGHSRSP